MGALPVRIAIPASKKSISPSHGNCRLFIRNSLCQDVSKQDVFAVTVQNLSQCLLGKRAFLNEMEYADCMKEKGGLFRKP